MARGGGSLTPGGKAGDPVGQEPKGHTMAGLTEGLFWGHLKVCLLYTSYPADDPLYVVLGRRPIIKI